MFDYISPEMLQEHYEEILRKAEKQHSADSLPVNRGPQILIRVLQALLALLPMNAR
jgi:hypothetical protein